jgi:hypothetical protein
MVQKPVVEIFYPVKTLACYQRHLPQLVRQLSYDKVLDHWIPSERNLSSDLREEEPPTAEPTDHFCFQILQSVQ